MQTLKHTCTTNQLWATGLQFRWTKKSPGLVNNIPYSERVKRHKEEAEKRGTCHTQKRSKGERGMPVEKRGTCRMLLDELKDEAKPFVEHLFNKDWQNRAEELIMKLKADEVPGVYDFAENFKCAHQREVQSAYYSHDSATLHPVVLYYNCLNCLKTVRESIVLMSDDLTHDYHLIHAFQKNITLHLSQTTRGLQIATFYQFSDGCMQKPIQEQGYKT